MSSVQSAGTVQDDRVLPETHWLALCIIPFLIVASTLLYVWPTHTDTLFAWTIKPPMTPMMLAAAYLGGIYFFARVALAKQWHLVHLGFLPVTVFATMLGIATILHWDRFHHSHISFFTWVALYFTTPFLVFAVWLRNRATDPQTPEADDVIIPRGIRLYLGVIGALLLAVGVLLFILPDVMIRLWPWTLTPLTARVVGTLFTLPGVVGLGIAREQRWSAARILLEAQSFSLVMILIATARAWGDFKQSSPTTWLFVGGFSVLVVVLAVLYVGVERYRRTRARAHVLAV